jgi:hypothetical protein
MDRPRPRARRFRWPSKANNLVVGVGVSLTAVIALGAWLVLTDPAVAADVAAAGDLMPLVRAIMETLESTLAELLAYL